MWYKSDRQKWIAGLILILIVYTLFYTLFADRSYTYLIPRKIRHIIKFGTTIAVYLMGTYHLGKLKDQWMSSLWHFIHISLLIIITSIGIYDWIFGEVSYAVKDFTASLQEFLISPVLYVGMGLINQKLKSSG